MKIVNLPPPNPVAAARKAYFGVAFTHGSLSPTANQFIAPFDVVSLTTTQASHQMVIPRAATVVRFFVQISGNTLTTAETTLQVLNLSVGGSVDILVLAGVSGLVSNLTDTLDFAEGELMGFEVTIEAGGTGLFNMISMGAEVTWTA